MRGLAGGRLLADALAVDRIVDAVIAENARELIDVGKARQVFQRQRLVGQQGRDHQRQRGVLGAGNRDDAVEPGAAADLDPIHSLFLPTPIECVKTRALPRRVILSLRIRRRRRARPRRRGRRLLGRPGALLRLTSLQILSERSGEAGAPPVAVCASGVVRAHDVPSRTATGSQIALQVRPALDRAKRQEEQAETGRGRTLPSDHPAFSIRLTAAARASRVISAPASMRAISSRRSLAPRRATLVTTRSPLPTADLTIR